MIYDLVIIGGGAAGMAAAIFAGERSQNFTPKILILEGAKKPGAKILISGGGRCNVTNERIQSRDFNGGIDPIIRNVLKSFNEKRTLEWMESLGVKLKLEPTGKYFPVSNKASTILTALMDRIESLGIEFRTRSRVDSISISGDEKIASNDRVFFVHLNGSTVPVPTKKIIVATGGLALPKSGSDGLGIKWTRELGHTIIETTPALVPMLLTKSNTLGGHFEDFSGIAIDCRLSLRDFKGRNIKETSGALLFTHFGISGPVVMDMSRHIERYKIDFPGQPFSLSLSHPRFKNKQDADAWLQLAIKENGKRNTLTLVKELFPERIAEAIVGGNSERLCDMNKERRLNIVDAISDMQLDVYGNRGYAFAETTAGGVDLREIDYRTMESRIVPGLHLCGEILDVDGRIGGFNFQWAWASGYVAGNAVAKSLNRTS